MNFNVANMSFIAICENKLIAKISEFTVTILLHRDFSGKENLSFKWDNILQQSYHMG